MPISPLEASPTGGVLDVSPPRDFVALLPEADRLALERIARRVTFPPATVIVHEGVHPESVVVLLDGLVKVTSIAASGRELILAICGRGELIGELAAIDDQPHAGTVITIGGVAAMVLSPRAFRAYLEQHPGAAVAALRSMGDRFRNADRRLVEFAAGDALGRLASRLVELCVKYGEPAPKGVAIALHLSQEELASWAGCSTKAAVNALHTLRGLGLVETGRRQITVLDPDALRAHAVAPV